MNIFITGQKSFGKAVFKALLEDGHRIVGVAPAPPDKYYDKLHAIALRHHVPVVGEAGRLASDQIPAETDLIVSAHSHWYVSDKAVEKARLGAIGFHPSLLPRHRGRDAIRWTVACGDPVTGGSIYWLDKVVDGGPILLQRHIFVDRRWDHHELWTHLFPLGVQMMREAVAMLERGEIISEPQDPTFATWEPPYDATARLYRPELFQLPPPVGVDVPQSKE